MTHPGNLIHLKHDTDTAWCYAQLYRLFWTDFVSKTTCLACRHNFFSCVYEIQLPLPLTSIVPTI